MKTLLEIERIRKGILAKFFFLRVMAVTATFFVAFFLMFFIMIKAPFAIETVVYGDDRYAKIIAIIGALLVVFVIYGRIFEYLVAEESKEFVRQYKNEYLAGYIESLGFKYQRVGHVHALDIMKSNLFALFDKQTGNDKISGEIDGVRFVFSDLILQDICEGEDWRTGFKSKNYSTIFQGLFFFASFNKTIGGQTFVMSRNIPNNPNVKQIKMDNVEFNKFFNVYTTDIQDAMYILSPVLMESILSLAKRMRAPIGISFVDDRIFIRIDRWYDSFEPDIHQSVISKNIAPTIKKDIESMLEIVKILRLT